MDNSEIKWVSVNEALPDTAPCRYVCERSEKVLVRGKGKNAYPWVAHLWVDKAKTCKDYAWGFDRDGVRYTWLCPYRDIATNQQVTEWAYLSDSASDDAFSLGVEAGLANSPDDCAEQLAAIADALRAVASGMSWVAQYAEDVTPEMRSALSAHAAEMGGAARMAEEWSNAIVAA